MSRASLDKDSDWDDDRWAAEVDVTRHYHDPVSYTHLTLPTNREV